MRIGIWLVFAICAVPFIAFGQARPLPGPDVQQIYQRLLPQIEKIPIFDHHAHPGFADDPDVDAMASPPGSAALRTRDTNPELIAASKALFGYPYNDLSPEHAKWLVQKKAELKKEQGNAYFSNLLDKLNIEQGVANRAMMADYLDPRRFPWVFFADSFMWPLNNQRERARNRDEEVYLPLQEKMLHRWMQQENVDKLPPDLPGYLAFVSSHSRRQSEKRRDRHEVRSGVLPFDEIRRPHARAGRRCLPALRGWRNSQRTGVPDVSGLHFPLSGPGGRKAALAGPRALGRGHRRLLQSLREATS